MFYPHKFRPIGNYCLIRRIDQSLSASVIVPPTATRRNLVASLIDQGDEFQGGALNGESVMVPWMWGTEDDSMFFQPPFERYLIIPGHRIRAIIVGEAHRRRVVPLGAHYLVRQLPETQEGSFFIPAQYRQSLDFEVIRRGRPVKNDNGSWNACGNDLEPGMRGRISAWQQSHVEVETDEGACLIVPEKDILYYHDTH